VRCSRCSAMWQCAIQRPGLLMSARGWPCYAASSTLVPRRGWTPCLCAPSSLASSPALGNSMSTTCRTFGVHRPARMRLDVPEGETYNGEIIDTWEMTVTPISEQSSAAAGSSCPTRSIRRSSSVEPIRATPGNRRRVSTDPLAQLIRLTRALFIAAKLAN
jgi:hypothetical protein